MTIRRRQRTLASVALTLACVATAAAVNAAAASPVVQGETVVSGGAGTYAAVTLDRPMRVTSGDPDQWLDAELDGTGEILGVEIRGTTKPDDPLRRSPPSVRIWRTGSRDTYVKSQLAVGVDQGVLPPGRYRIYLISDQPSTARLKFPKQPGHVAIPAASPYPFWGGVLPQHTQPGGIVTFGDEHPMPTRGLLLLNLMPYEGDDEILADRIELCLYKDGTAGSAGDTAFAPRCPGGQTLVEYSRPQRSVRIVTFTVDFAPIGLTGFGGNIERLGTSSPVYAAAAWVGYIEDEGPAAIPPPPVTRPATPQILELRARRLRRARTRALIPVRCQGPSRCRGHVTLGGGPRVAYSLAAASRRTLRVPLTRRLRRHRRAVQTTLTIVTITNSTRQRDRIRVTLRPSR